MVINTVMNMSMLKNQPDEFGEKNFQIGRVKL